MPDQRAALTTDPSATDDVLNSSRRAAGIPAAARVAHTGASRSVRNRTRLAGYARCCVQRWLAFLGSTELRIYECSNSSRVQFVNSSLPGFANRDSS